MYWGTTAVPVWTLAADKRDKTSHIVVGTETDGLARGRPAQNDNVTRLTCRGRGVAGRPGADCCRSYVVRNSSGRKTSNGGHTRPAWRVYAAQWYRERVSYLQFFYSTPIPTVVIHAVFNNNNNNNNRPVDRACSVVRTTRRDESVWLLARGASAVEVLVVYIIAVLVLAYRSRAFVRDGGKKNKYIFNKIYRRRNH